MVYGWKALLSHNNNNNSNNNDNDSNNHLYFTRVTQSNTGFDFRCGPQEYSYGNGSDVCNVPYQIYLGISRNSQDYSRKILVFPVKSQLHLV